MLLAKAEFTFAQDSKETRRCIFLRLSSEQNEDDNGQVEEEQSEANVSLLLARQTYQDSDPVYSLVLALMILKSSII